MVRVGSLQERANLEQEQGKKVKRENKTNMSAAEQLTAIMPKTAQLQEECDKYYAKALEALAECGWRKVDLDHLSKEDEHFWKKYFQTELFPILSPQIVDNRHPFPFLRNKEIYLGVLLKEKHPAGQSLGIIPISSQMERMHVVKRRRNAVCTYRRAGAALCGQHLWQRDDSGKMSLPRDPQCGYRRKRGHDGS